MRDIRRFASSYLSYFWLFVAMRILAVSAAMYDVVNLEWYLRTFLARVVSAGLVYQNTESLSM